MQLRSHWQTLGLLLTTALCAPAQISAVVTNATREFVVQKQFLNLPVKNGAPARHLKLLVDGNLERFFDIEIAEGEPDWWAFIDMKPWQGRLIALQAEGIR